MRDLPVERGVSAGIPYAAVGSGSPVVVAAGLWPTTGVASARVVGGAVAPLRRVSDERRVVVLNRRPGLPGGMTMGDLAAEYAAALEELFGGPADVLGSSTGGSIAQQLAADHPGAVGRLVLLSTACRLGPLGRALQAEAAEALRRGDTRRAVSVVASGAAPPGLRSVAGMVGRLASGQVVPSAADAADLATTLEAEDGFDLASCSRTIGAPTLVVAGGRDRFYGADLFAETVRLIPGAVLRVFPRRGHVSVTTDPRAQATIASFLSAPAGPPAGAAEG